MFKVIIVDDEPTIKEGLKSLIPWESCGFQVVDTASNGKEALELLEHVTPDLMIVDIRMPGMSGLNLIETIRQTNNDTHFVILSGYADFEYAKKSISLNVDGYLLKPVDEDELIEYLVRINTLLTQQTEVKQVEEAEKDWRREVFLHALISDELHEDASVYLDRASQVDLVWKSYQVLLLKLHEHIEPDSSTMAALKFKLTSVFNDTDRGVLFTKEPYWGVLLKDVMKHDQKLKTLYQEMLLLMNEFNYDFSAAVGDVVYNVADIGRSYSMASELQKQQFFMMGGGILTMDDSSQPSSGGKTDLQTPNGYDINISAEKLFYALEVGNKASVKLFITEASHQFKQEGCSEQTMKSKFIQLLSAALNKLASVNPTMHSHHSEYASRILDIYKQPNLNALLNYMNHVLHEVIDLTGIGSTDQQLKQMMDLIHRNYGDNLRLEGLAEVFNYNSAYLGKLFKNYTGEYFNTYLDKVRIEKAKEMLQQGMKVYQVAELVGYTNVDYFYTKFKKYEGISPSLYRGKQS